MPDFRVTLTDSLANWQLTKAVFEKELIAIDKFLNVPLNVRSSTEDEFAAHLLDVHRMWCEACPPPGGRGVVGSQRPDPASGGSADAALAPCKQKRVYVSTSTQTTNDIDGLTDVQQRLDQGVVENADDGNDGNDDGKETIPMSTSHGENEKPHRDDSLGEPSSVKDLIKVEVMEDDDDLYNVHWTDQDVKEEPPDNESIIEENDEMQRDEDASPEGWVEEDQQPLSFQGQMSSTHQHPAGRGLNETRTSRTLHHHQRHPVMAAKNWMVLCFNGSNKKISFQESEFVSIEELVKQAENKFPGIKGMAVRLQVYDKEVEEFIDVEIGEEVPVRSKVKVLRTAIRSKVKVLARKAAEQDTCPRSVRTSSASQVQVLAGTAAEQDTRPNSVRTIETIQEQVVARTGAEQDIHQHSVRTSSAIQEQVLARTAAEQDTCPHSVRTSSASQEQVLAGTAAEQDNLPSSVRTSETIQEQVVARTAAEQDTRPHSERTSNAIQEPKPCEQTASTRASTSVRAWFTNFKLPVFPDALADTLESGQTTAANDSAILDVLYESVKPFTLYPTPTQYAEIVGRLLARYPKLSSHLDAINQKQLWVRKLQYKFQNTRRRDETLRTSSAVRQRKRKQPPSQAQKKAAKEVIKYPPVWMMANCLPTREASDDEESIKLHKKWLVSESKKKRPDVDEVEARMNLTFAYRRSEIVTGNLSFTKVKEEYPWLLKEGGRELLTEFRRIHGSSDIMHLMKTGLHTFARSLVGAYKDRCFRMKGNRDSTLWSMIHDIEKIANEKAREDAEGKAALTTIPTLLGEKDNIYKYQVDGDNSLGIFLKINEISPMHATDFSLMVDDTMVCRVDDIMRATACYLAAYYVFNLQYEASLHKTLEFCQLALLQVKDKCPTDRQVLTLISRLHRRSQKQRPASE